MMKKYDVPIEHGDFLYSCVKEPEATHAILMHELLGVADPEPAKNQHSFRYLIPHFLWISHWENREILFRKSKNYDL